MKRKEYIVEQLNNQGETIDRFTFNTKREAKEEITFLRVFYPTEKWVYYEQEVEIIEVMQ